MTRYQLITAGCGALAFASVAHAHPGHGEPGDDFSLLHYATEPLHLGVGLCLAFVAIAAFGLLRAYHGRSWQRESAL